jgi:hypothetical protein
MTLLGVEDLVWGKLCVMGGIFSSQSLVVRDSLRSLIDNEVLAAESLEGSYFIYQVTYFWICECISDLVNKITTF